MKKESLLWKFWKSNESRQNYLLGTMHVNSEQAYGPVASSKKLMEECEYYVGELDLDDSRLNEMAQLYQIPDGVHLRDIIGGKKYKKYRKIIAHSFNIELNTIAHFRPLIITNMIAESIMTREYDLSLDYFLWKYAVSSGMKVHGLESFDDQKHILLSVPMEVQLKGLKDMVKSVSSFRKTILKTSEDYANGKLSKLYKTTKKSLGSLRALMIYDRNTIMTERLVKIVEEGSTFCAVGAGHLPGKYGMLRKLKMEGFNVKPIML